MQHRDLSFQSFNDVRQELDRLRSQGYSQSGSWNLAQTCDHLAYFIEATLDGAKFRVPWLFKILFGRLVLKRILSTRRMKANVPTPQTPLPAPNLDEAAQVERLRRLLDRLQQHQGEMHASPFFGRMTPEQWRELHLIHCAHHLGYLIPK